MRPGFNIKTREASTPSSPPTATGIGFMAAVLDAGPSDAPFKLTSPDEAIQKAGAWSTTSATGFNAIDAFFGEGGSELWVSRISGPAAVKATANLDGTTAGAPYALQAVAKGVGEYANAYRIRVMDNSDDPAITSGSFQLRIQNSDGSVIYEESPIFPNKAAALSWSPNSKFIDLVDGAEPTNPAKAAGVALTGGLLDAAAVTDAQRQAALDRFNSDLGPGNVFMPGATTTAQHAMLDAHAANNNRVAIKNGDNSKVVATLVAKAAGSRSRFGALFAPWVVIPGLPTSPAVLRTVSPDAIVAGIIGRNDGAGMSPNIPAAGINGISRLALQLSQSSWTDAERTTLNNAGVNVLKQDFQGIKVYGWRTTADPISDRRWRNFGNSRLHRAISALAGAVAERHVFDQIDGEGYTFATFNGELVGEAVMPFYRQGSLYGRTPEEAFTVDTGPNVNTPTTIDNDEIRAVITVVMSPFGEEVTVEIVKKTVTEGVS